MRNPTPPINILFVLQDKTLENLLRKILPTTEKEPEWHAAFVSSGQAALAHLKNSFPVKIIFTELNLPMSNGLSLLHQIRTEYPAILSVLLSPKEDYHTIRAALNSGVFDFLLLPLDAEDFRTTFKKALLESDRVRQTMVEYETLLTLENELEIARNIQMTVISSRDSLATNDTRLNVTGHSQPAQKVGGDFFDHFFLDKDHLGFVIGDVASKGLPAALYMAISRTLIRSLAIQGFSPDDCLKEVNQILFRESDPSLFIAVFYGVIDLNTGFVTYSNGGHTFPYHRCSKGSVRQLDEPGGMVLGATETAVYTRQYLQLAAGDILFIYTDGFLSLTDSRDESPFESHIVKYLARADGEDLSEFVQKIFEDMCVLSENAPIEDDLTGFAVRYNGPLKKPVKKPL